ncbi:MAG: radical SAM protein [Byssovorax sp.]
MLSSSRKRAVLLGIAGSYSAFSLSLYNLKAHAYRDPGARRRWDIEVLQHPLIDVAARAEKVAALADRIAALRPTLVGFSCYLWNLEELRALAVLLRRALPGVVLLWGGPEMTTDYVAAGKLDGDEIDLIVSGEGEQSFLEILLALPEHPEALASIAGLSYRRPGERAFTINDKREPFPSLAHVPSPYLTGVVDDAVLHRPGVEANIETQRGCTLKCTYCIYHKDMSRIAYSGADRVLDEVMFVVNKGVRKIRFVDANFSSDLDHAKAVMRGLIVRHVEAKLTFELIPGFLDEELAALMGEYNALHPWNEITLGVGVQTINFGILRKMRRGISVEKFEATFALLEKYEIFAKIDLIIGLPGEDLRSIERTLEYMIERLRRSRAHLLCCHVMRGLPGTELLEQAIAHEMVFSSARDPHELIESPALPRPDMLKCLRRTAVVFRLINHGGWARSDNIEINALNTAVGDEHVAAPVGSASIRDAFFAARDRLGISNVALCDLLVEGLMKHLAPRGSWFALADFPHAETWWWSRARDEVSDEWLCGFLDGLSPAHRAPASGREMAEVVS